jgi:hypothetical protein
MIRRGKSKKDRWRSEEKRTIEQTDPQNTHRKTKIEQHERHYKLWVNRSAPKGWTEVFRKDEQFLLQ